MPATRSIDQTTFAVQRQKEKPASTARAREIVEWFGLTDTILEPNAKPSEPPLEVLSAVRPDTGRLHLITGNSGSGKSTLLRQACQQADATGLRVLRVGAPERPRSRLDHLPVIDQFPSESVEGVVSRLAWTGLAEPAVLLQRASSLSTGERFRLDIARAVYDAENSPQPALLSCDEFTSALDDASAVAAAHMLRRLLRNGATINLAILLATWREDLLPYLDPHRVIRCDHGLWEITERKTRDTTA